MEREKENYICKQLDYIAIFLNEIFFNAQQLPNPLPWIEPSINKLHLEAAKSFLFGNYECTIIACGILLEHVLRLALVNDGQCGLKRPESIKKIDSYSCLDSIISAADGKIFFKDWV